MAPLYKNIIFLIILIFSVSTQKYAQTLNFQNYTTKDGLPQSTIFDIVQDSLGFIWFGTEAGLGRFDGINVKTYNLNNGIVGNNIGALHLDRFGSLWIGTNDGLSIMFEEDVKNYTTKNGLPDDFIYGIEEDADGSVWLATRYGGACRFIGSEIKLYNQSNGFPSDQLTGVYRDKKDNIWFTTIDKGIIKYNGRDFINYSVNDGLISNSVTAVFEDNDGMMWIGTDVGVTMFNGKTFFQFSSKEGIPPDEVEVIVQDFRGDIWLGFSSSGVYRYDGRKFFKHDGLASDEIRDAFVDKRGDIWFGTFLGGISRLSYDWFEIFDEYDGINFKDVYSIAQDNSGSMYFCHLGKGVSVFRNGKYERITTASGLISNDVSSVLFDTRNNLWFGTLNGVTKFNGKNAKSFSRKNGLEQDNVLKMYEDRKGFLWIAAVGGVSKYDYKQDKIVGVYKQESGFDENAWVNDIFEDNSGAIWFATHHSGLIKYDGNNFIKLDTANGLPINNLFSITQDKHGYYWIGTDGKGVCRYDGNESIVITEKDGLTSDVSYFVLEEGNEIFIGTLNGISILQNDNNLNKEELKFRYISQTEGIPSKELNQNSYFKDNAGNLWFGTLGGLIKIDPNKTVGDELLPIFLSSITVSDGIHEENFHSSITEDLNYEQNNITFEFYTITFAKPLNTLYEFKLEGVEDNWSKTKENIVTYRALPSGSYNFWARAKNHPDAAAQPKLLVSFTIGAPFYKTWWFISSSVILFILFIYSFYFYKTYQVKKRNEALEAMVRDRTSALEQEKNKSDELLHNILPSSLVDELKIYGNVRPRRFNSISIMFTDFKAFTYTTSVLPPEELVHELNDIFKNFDALIGKYGLEKLKTIGDSYMAACGIPNEMDDHAIRIVYAALDFQKMIKERNKTSAIKWEMRLGIHSGSVVAGVVGTKKFTYDIWGDTVNIASRMESSGEPGEINISGYTYMLIRDHFNCEYRGKVETKGKGSIDMYFVKGVNHNKITINRQTFKTFKPYKQIN